MALKLSTSFTALGAVALGAACLATAAPALAASPPSLEGDWLQKVKCPARGTAFNNQMRIYREGDGLKFVARAPVLNVSPSDENPAFSSVYYGKADLNGDLLTLRISDRYKREYQEERFGQSGQFVAQDATFRVTPQGELVALSQGACTATPFRPVGRQG